MGQKGALLKSSGSSTKWVKEVSLGELGREKASLPLCERRAFSLICTYFYRIFWIGSSLNRSWSHRSCPGCSHGSSVGLLIGKRMAKGGDQVAFAFSILLSAVEITTYLESDGLRGESQSFSSFFFFDVAGLRKASASPRNPLFFQEIAQSKRQENRMNFLRYSYVRRC